MSLISRRKRPHLGLLVLGVISGALCGYGLVTGRFFLPMKGEPYRDHFVTQSLDPRLFLFWIRVSAIYCLGLSLFAFVRLDPIENRVTALPQSGKSQMTGRPRVHLGEVLLGVMSLLVLYICYLLTLK